MDVKQAERFPGVWEKGGEAERHDLQNVKNVMHQNFKQFSNELRKKYIKMRKFKEG